MATLPRTRLVSFRAAAALLAISACTSASPQGGGDARGPGDPLAREERQGAVCPHCTLAGGDTSDFGSEAPPDPCDTGRTDVPSEDVSEAEARALGFGVALDALAQRVSVPFEWTRPEQSPSPPEPTGYAERTLADVETTVTRIKRPMVAGCDDRVDVDLAVSFATQDGALSVTGAISGMFDRAAMHGAAYGALDLAAARGTLRVSPPPSFAKTAGRLQFVLHFWPDAMRGGVKLLLMELREDPNDALGAQGTFPLEGRFPIDSCWLHERPLEASARSLALSGKSPDELRATFAALLAARSPGRGKWTNGGDTRVSMEMGSALTDICVAPRSISFRVPLSIHSDDGRVRIEQQPAIASLLLAEDGTPTSAVTYIDRPQVIQLRELAAAGISGVELGAHERAVWSVELDSIPHGGGTPVGALTVRAVGPIPGASDGELVVLRVAAGLRWSLDDMAQ